MYCYSFVVSVCREVVHVNFLSLSVTFLNVLIAKESYKLSKIGKDFTENSNSQEY